MKRVLIIAATCFLPACAALQDAGTARYKVAPFIDSNGKIVCCSADIVNGKNIGGVSVTFTNTNGNVAFSLQENGVDAKTGQDAANAAVGTIAKTAADAALIAGAVAAAPVALPAIGAALSAPGIGAATLGAGGALLLKNSQTLRNPQQ